MVANSSRLAHTACGNDHLGLCVFIDGFGIICRYRQSKSIKPNGVDAFLNHRQGFLVKTIVTALQEDARSFHRQGAVHVYGKIAKSRDKPFLLDLTDGVKNFLRSAYRKGRNDNVSSAIKGFLNIPCKLGNGILRFFMQTVSVGRFDHKIVCFLHILRIFDDWLIGIAHISRKYDLSFLSVFLQPNFNTSRTEQMSHIGESNRRAFGNEYFFFIIRRTEQRYCAHGVCHSINRLDSAITCTLGFSRLPHCLKLLNMGRISEHNVTEISGFVRCVDLTAKAVFIKLRQHTRMVNVSVCQKHRFDFRRNDWQGNIFKNVHTLFHSAIDQVLVISHSQQGTGTRNLVRGTDKLNFHICSSFILILSMLPHLQYTMK